MSPSRNVPSILKNRVKEENANYTVLKSRKSKEITVVPHKGRLISFSDLAESQKAAMAEEQGGRRSQRQQQAVIKTESPPESSAKHKKKIPSPIKHNIVKKFANKTVTVKKTARKTNHVSAQSALRVVPQGPGRPAVKAQDTDRRIEENEQFIIDLLSRSQPHHDHCYTTIFGKKRGIETMHWEIDTSEEEDEDVVSRTSALKVGKSGSPESYDEGENTSPSPPTVLPFGRLSRIPVAPDGTPLISQEEIVSQDKDSFSQHSQMERKLIYI